MRIEFPLLLDHYRCYFGRTVRLIALRVITFSQSYIKNDLYYLRFHFVLFAFVASIFLLIFSPRAIRIFLGWDGLGVTSYFLVIYFENAKRFNAGLLTALRNRVGDVLFLLSLLFYRELLRFNFFVWRIRIKNINWVIIFVLGVACCTKRAQIPFSAWLPAAIAAPTPVSSLVHSSTLVTAGVYIIFRLSPLISFRKFRDLLFFLGCITISIAGLSALQEIDAKKIVALSTLSQLGLIIMTLGIGAEKSAFFHLISHAFFKALLFIVVGNIIHLSRRYQDLRKMSVIYYISFKRVIIGRVSNFSLIGLPFLSGFYSKDLCVEIRVISLNNFLGVLIFFGGIVLTILYSLRFRELAFRNHSRGVNFREEENHYGGTKCYLYLLRFALLGSAVLRWVLFLCPNNLFFSKHLNLFILRVIIISFFIKKKFLVKINNEWALEGIFFIWNLGSITRFLPRHRFTRSRKLRFKMLESNWFPSRFWIRGAGIGLRDQKFFLGGVLRIFNFIGIGVLVILFICI